MKTIMILPLLIASSMLYARIPVNINLSKASEIISYPSHHIRLITKEGYRLEGLLMTSNDSQLIIFPGKYKEWKLKKNYMIVHYSYVKIGTVKLSKLKDPMRRIFKNSKKNMTQINGCKDRFLSLREVLSDKKSES